MKARFYIGLISALLLAGSPMAAQYADDGFRSGSSGQVINNYYYNDYDYYFASRINRFHRTYTAFDYYSPVFTEAYYYNYRPFSWGISIYGGGGFGFGAGYSYRYPVYSYSYYDPYYGSSWYYGYDPYYFGYDPFYYGWYSPVVININVRNRWRPYYRSWYGYDSWYYGRNHYYYNYRPVYHATNNYYYYDSPRYSSRSVSYQRSNPEYNRSNSGVESRRDGAVVPGSRSSADNSSRRTPANAQSGEIRRNVEPAGNKGTVSRTASQPSTRVISAPSRNSTAPSRSSATMSQNRASSSSGSSAVSGSKSSSSRSSGSVSRSSGSVSRSSGSVSRSSGSVSRSSGSSGKSSSSRSSSSKSSSDERSRR